ncbi:magnesium transporter [Candidatus Babela massiliensis]|uniref:Magnesium transporter MgtE n=1 Tax=Candidatus Babela massiliensis TaxID=673862 RepID=V6DGF1_9BACT|nr:magnesium transporter [Candidatus Babela massiliensis]CDK30645.1 Mg/Co/Ni transporter MgtE (contains CBS domain) [Candidatus Babela massiliensis]
MSIKQTFNDILDNIDDVIAQSSDLGVSLWQDFLDIHPADIAQFLSDINQDKAKVLFLAIPKKLKFEVFSYLSEYTKKLLLSTVPDTERSALLSSLPLDELTDLLDYLSDEELKNYLKLLHKKDREKVVSLMQFESESAGGIMHTDVLTLMQDLTIEKSINILQRLQPKKELHRVIYVTTRENELVGYINLEDLVLRKPVTKLDSIVKEAELIVNVHEDQEKVAQDMSRYKLTIAPVVSDNNIFLGIIDSDALVGIIEQEAAEDVYKISALTPIKHTYFETPFSKLYYQRVSILAILLLTQTFSALIIKHYEDLLTGFLIIFLTMIASTGGNVSSQTSALVIQGLVSGEISDANRYRFLWRELLMACAIGGTLAIVSFIRVFATNPDPSKLLSIFSISLSIAAIVIVSVMLGSIIPLVLKRFKLDPALSAGPFLATIMDILGILIYCNISRIILGL